MKIKLRDLGYWPYVALKKLQQLPKVRADREPRFVLDETVTSAAGDVYAIVVCFSGFGVPDDLVALFAALRRAGINAIVVCNGDPNPETLQRLRASAHRILVRENIGRDIGAYRAATLYLNAHALPAERVLYFNDSLIYLDGEPLDRTIRALAESPYPVTGTFENHECHHHIGSYAFAVDRAVFTDRHVLDFWRDYRPYDIRPHAIHNGEVALSRRLKALGYEMDVVYSIDRLGRQLRTMDVARVLALAGYMPTVWKSKFLEHVSHRSRTPGSGAIMDLIIGSSVPPASSSSEAVRSSPLDIACRDLTKDALIDTLLGEIGARSQVHWGFGLYHTVMKTPLVKKDLLQRGLFSEHDCSRILDDLPEVKRDAVMRQLINRGRPVNLQGMRRFRMYHGLE